MSTGIYIFLQSLKNVGGIIYNEFLITHYILIGKDMEQSDRKKAYEQRNKDAGNRKISFYLQPAGQQILDQFKNEFGVSNVTLINSLFSAAKEKPFLLKAIMDYDINAIKETIKVMTEKLILSEELLMNGLADYSPARIEEAVHENTKLYGKALSIKQALVELDKAKKINPILKSK